ncbi:MAG: peptidase T [Desulfobacula sp.]|nr:peptidase T [Desulfobacula sp.]
MKTQLLDRFIAYVKIDTQSDENSETVPSTDKQFDLAELLVKELTQMGLDAVELDDHCYVYAKLDSNIPRDHPVFQKAPKLGFLAHMDTSPSVTGKNVNPQIIKGYRGGDIKLNDAFTITDRENPVLKRSIGHTIITTDGTTLLGADDKSGIAIIMTVVNHLKNNPSILHPDIRIGFTPDEEIGRGALHFNLEKFDADFAYTVDGGPAGEINNETFSADAAVISIKGRDIHPGEAKDIMVNALKVAADIISLLPKDMTPETTSDKESFIHPHFMEGQVGGATIKLLLRAFDTQTLKKQKNTLKQIISKVRTGYPNALISLEISDTYRNMNKTLETVPHVSRYLEEAVKRTGLEAKWVPVRGGTDGSGLTAMGLPCPNIFTGGYNFHGQTEWISLNVMEKSFETLLKLIQVCIEKA